MSKKKKKTNKTSKAKKATTKKKKKPRKRTDKILNNSYKTGENLKGEDYEFSKTIKVKDDYASKYLKDVYDYENHVEYKIVLDKILELIESDSELKKIYRADDQDSKKKYNSKEINLIFGKVYDALSKKVDTRKFLNPIYMVEGISRFTGLPYKRIFDFLEYEYQAILLQALNEKYDIFGENSNDMH